MSPIENSAQSKLSSNYGTLSLCIVLAGIVLTLMFLSRRTLIVFPVLLAPTVVLLQHERLHNPSNFNLNGLSSIYLLTGTLGIAIIATVQGIFLYAFVYLLFGRHAQAFLQEWARSPPEVARLDEATLASRERIRKSWRFWVLLVFLTFVLAGLGEEWLKCGAILLARRWGWLQTEHDYLVYAGAAALGYGMIENVGFVYAAIESQKEPWGILTLVVLERIIIAASAHVMLSTWTAANLVESLRGDGKVHWVAVLLGPAMAHGGFDFMLLACSAINGNIGWVHPKGWRRILTMLVMVSLYLAIVFAIVKDRQSLLSATGARL